MRSSLLIWTSLCLIVQLGSSATINLPTSLSLVNTTQDLERWTKQVCINTTDWMGPGRPSSFKFSDCGQAFRQIQTKANEYGRSNFMYLAIGGSPEYPARVRPSEYYPNIQLPQKFVYGKFIPHQFEWIRETLGIVIDGLKLPIGSCTVALMLDWDCQTLQIPGISRGPHPDEFFKVRTYASDWLTIDEFAGRLYDKCDLGASKLGWGVVGE